MDITTQRQIDQLAHDVERLRKADTALTGVRARIYNSANESIPNSTVTTVTWNSNRYDPTNMGDANGYTIVTPGAYHVGAGVRWAANATGQRVLYIILNGATFLKINAQQAVTGGNPTDMGVETVYEFVAGDTVRLQAFQDSGGALNITAAGNYSPEMWISRIA
jgi:hypothetical protein